MRTHDGVRLTLPTTRPRLSFEWTDHLRSYPTAIEVSRLRCDAMPVDIAVQLARVEAQVAKDSSEVGKRLLVAPSNVGKLLRVPINHPNEPRIIFESRRTWIIPNRFLAGPRFDGPVGSPRAAMAPVRTRRFKVFFVH